jgi:putative transposase
VLRLAGENDWGYERIEGELLKLGYAISDETVGNILRRHGIPPAPERDSSPSWRHLMTQLQRAVNILGAVAFLAAPFWSRND